MTPGLEGSWSVAVSIEHKVHPYAIDIKCYETIEKISNLDNWIDILCILDSKFYIVISSSKWIPWNIEALSF